MVESEGDGFSGWKENVQSLSDMSCSILFAIFKDIVMSVIIKCSDYMFVYEFQKTF